MVNGKSKPLNLNVFIGATIAIILGIIFVYILNIKPEPMISDSEFILSKNFKEKKEEFISKGWSYYIEALDTNEFGPGVNVRIIKAK